MRLDKQQDLISTRIVRNIHVKTNIKINMKIKLLFTLIFGILLLSSCKNRKEIVQTYTEQITTIEYIDTLIKIPPKELSILKPINELLEPYIIEDTKQLLKVQYNPVSGEINVYSKIKEQEIPININKTTINSKQIKQEEYRVGRNAPEGRRNKIFSLRNTLLFISFTLIMLGVISLKNAFKGITRMK